MCGPANLRALEGSSTDVLEGVPSHTHSKKKARTRRCAPGIFSSGSGSGGGGEDLAADFGFGLGGEGGREVAFAGRAGDRDDQLALVLGPLGQLDGGPDVGPGADADQNAFFLGQAAGHGKSV